MCCSHQLPHGRCSLSPEVERFKARSTMSQCINFEPATRKIDRKAPEFFFGICMLRYVTLQSIFSLKISLTILFKGPTSEKTKGKRKRSW